MCVVAILAGKFTALSKPAFIVCFALLQVGTPSVPRPPCPVPVLTPTLHTQFFFNFGANTYVSHHDITILTHQLAL